MYIYMHLYILYVFVHMCAWNCTGAERPLSVDNGVINGTGRTRCLFRFLCPTVHYTSTPRSSCLPGENPDVRVRFAVQRLSGAPVLCSMLFFPESFG